MSTEVNMLRVREIRQKKGITVEQLAQMSGLAVRTVTRLERPLGSRRGPDFDTLEKVAKALDVSLRDLI